MAGAAAQPVRKARDERLDLVRGITMLIIFVAHVPANAWNAFIPARFGFSSGTELFVFCSGLASAIAFGRVFARSGWWLGTARIVQRMWQVYWAHAGLVLSLVALAALVDRLIGTSHLATQFGPLLTDPVGALIGLVSLTWLPDYLDILPVYLVILALLPVMVAAWHVAPAAPAVLSLALYAAAWGGLNLPGNPWNGAGWFLNPFAWQLIFFLGFAFGSGWLRPPRLREPRLLALSAAIVLTALPLSFWAILQAWPPAQEARDWLLGSDYQSNLHPLRVLHFLAVAYLALSLIEPYRERLDRGLGHQLIVIGRQSLAAFLASLVLARVGGVLADMAGHGPLAVAAINLAGFLAIYAVAVVVTWFKSSPWTDRTAGAGSSAARSHATVNDGADTGAPCRSNSSADQRRQEPCHAA